MIAADVAKRLAQLPRVALLSGPTPFEHWPRLSKELGIRLFAKRDDLGGIGLGGNKLRKLELLLGKAMAEDPTWLLTTGGPQSNHARLTAAVAAKLGLGCTVVLKGQAGPNSGNLLLDRLFGAEMRFVDTADYADVYREMEREAERLRGRGERPWQIPLGGATAEGTAAYVSAGVELFGQAGEFGVRPDVVVVAAGTGSTYSGLWLGARLCEPDTKVLGVSVSRSAAQLDLEMRELIRQTAELLALTPEPAGDLWLEEGFIGPGYARVSIDGLAALKLVARSEGVVLDTSYTAKAFAGLLELVRSGKISKGSAVVFVHTGGTPELFSRAPGELD